MDSLIFREEINKLRFRNIDDAAIRSVAERVSGDPKVMEQYYGSDSTLDEYVRVLAESMPAGEISNEHLKNFLQAKRLLKEAILKKDKDQDMINWYSDRIKEDRALPILGAEEISLIIIISFLTGIFSNIAKNLVDKLFSKKGVIKKKLREALYLIFANSILDLLEKHKEGLTADTIAKLTDIRPEEAIEYLRKYELQDWILKKAYPDQEKWQLKKEKAKIIEGYLKSGGG